MGTRLGGASDGQPKGLVDVGGKSLLARSLETLAEHSVTDVTMVVGYEHEAIRRAFGGRYSGIALSYVRNEQYETTGSMYSFSRTRGAVVREDVLLLESDLLFASEAIAAVLQAPFANVLLAAPVSGSGDEVFLCADGSGRLTDLGKQLPPAARSRAVGELVGISRLSAPFLDALFAQAERDYRDGHMTAHYEECVLAVSGQGRDVYVVVRDGLAWTEIDNPADLERARRDILPRLPQPA